MAAVAPAAAQDLKDLEKRVTDFTLSNGLRFVLLERHEAPVISFHTYINAGSVNDPAGQTGLARLMERAMLKGSESIGTRNWPDEKKALDAMDEAYDRMEAERNKGPRTNESQFETLRTQWRLAADAASRLGQPGEYQKILEENGATGLKSTSTWDALQLSYTLPSNRIELWFAMESQRLMHPVLREFYKERENLIEEHRKNQGNLQVRVFDALLGTAFMAHPYGRPMSGWASDTPELKRTEARAFLEKYAVPGNITMAMVGDVSPDEAKRLAEKYFGPMPSKPLPPQIHTLEPLQQGARTVVLEVPVQPVAAIGYKRPNYFDKDDTALDVLQTLLVSGNRGMAYRELVQEKRVAQMVQAGATFPDGRYPNLFLFFVAPTQGHTVEENLKVLEELLSRIKTKQAGLDALSQAKAQVRALSYQRLSQGPSLAEMLAVYTVSYGDWKKLFTLIEDVDKVAADDVVRVTQRYFNPANRTVVYTSIPGLPVSGTPARTGGGQ